MASMSQKPGKRWWIQFSHDRRRHTWRIGKQNKADAMRWKINVEALIENAKHGTRIPRDVVEWTEGLPERHRNWLRKHGLLTQTTKPETLRAFGDFVLAEHYGSAKPNTQRNMGVAINGMVAHFGASKRLQDITKGDLDLWREDMQAEDLAPATVAFYLKKCRRLLRLAEDHGVIHDTPFKKIAIPSEQNKTRQVYVPPDTIKKLLRVCSPEWQAAVCLCRFGGMRFPSEVFHLEWERVNWDLGRIVVHRPKTNRDVAIPMLPEVLTTLRTIWELADQSDRYVFPHYATGTCDRAGYRQLRRLVIRAGLTPWERLTTNLRVSLGVDWKLAGIPNETISEWLDHTEIVHATHYDLISDEEFARAAAVDSGILGHAAQPSDTTRA